MKKGWELKRLGDVCEILDSQRKPITKSDRVHGSIPYYGATGLQGYVDNFIFNEELVLVGEDGAKWGYNEQSAYIINGKSWVNNHAHVLRLSLEAQIGYVVYYLNHKDLNEFITGAVIRKLTQATLRKIEIPLPPIQVQQSIVKELDTLNDIITKKKQQLEELDKLAQATFYEMFGDPILNEKKWNSVRLETCVLKIGSGSTPNGGNQSYKNEGISLIRSLNVHNGKFIYKDLAYIDQEQAKKLNNVIIEEGDVLLNITGASVARSCIVPKNVLPARVNQHVSIIRPKKNVILPIFLNAQFTSNSFQSFLINVGRSNGATREAITKNQIEKFEVILPSVSFQKMFEERILTIESQKSHLHQSLSDTQQLFDYTMNKYFGS
jgi:type I restriction enzyme S subunit